MRAIIAVLAKFKIWPTYAGTAPTPRMTASVPLLRLFWLALKALQSERGTHVDRTCLANPGGGVSVM